MSKHTTRRRLVTWAAAASLAATLGLGASAAQAQQAFPSGPIRFVVGFSAGSSIDTVGRILADFLRTKYNWNIVVDNRTGANGAVAAEDVQKAAPDGYTVLISNSSSITVNPLVYKKLSYNPAELTPVTAVVAVPFILTINPENPRLAGVSTLADLMALARKKPNELTYGSAGNGNLIHLATELLATSADVKMTHVPFRGAAPMQVAILGKNIDFGFDTTSAVPHIKAGKLKALAVSSAERWPDLPDVPAVAEQGFAGYDVSFWVGVFLPPKTPAPIVETLSKAIEAATQDPATRELLSRQGRILTLTPAQFAEKIKVETARNAVIVRNAAIQLD